MVAYVQSIPQAWPMSHLLVSYCFFFLTGRQKKGKHVAAFRECFGKLAILRSFFREGKSEYLATKYTQKIKS